MSTTSKRKAWKLSPKYDDSDPDAKIFEEDILKIITKSTLYSQLPANRFPREDGYILGVKLRDPNDIPVVAVSVEKDLQEEVPEEDLIKASEPTESQYQMKEAARLANNKVAESYKNLNVNTSKTQKKEAFPDWFKSMIWRKNNGSLEKCICKVCSLNIISSDSFSAGHILPESKGGMMCLENIMPICPECNSQMGSRHLYWFAWHYYGKVMWSVY